MEDVDGGEARRQRRGPRAGGDGEGRAAAPAAAADRRPRVSTAPISRRSSAMHARGGLRVVSEPIPGVRSVAIGVWIGVGSRFERIEEAGISHFLEHMLFKGTPTLSPRGDRPGLRRASAARSTRRPARTTPSSTAASWTSCVDQAMPLLTDMLQRPTFVDLDQEREVVLEEIAMYEDDPQDQIHDLASVAVFPDQALGRPVIGTAAGRSARVPEDGVARVPPGPLHGPQHGRRGGRQRRARARHGAGRGLLGDLPRRPRRRGLRARRRRPPTLVSRRRPPSSTTCASAAPGPVAQRPAPARPVGARRGARRVDEQPPLPGGPREARASPTRWAPTPSGYADAGQVGVYLGTREDNLATACEVSARSCGGSATSRSPRTSCAAPRTTSRGAWSLGMESSGTRMNRIGRAVLTGTELLTVDERWSGSRRSPPATSRPWRGSTGARTRCRPRRSAPGAT